jgi:hypothetical protein
LLDLYEHRDLQAAAKFMAAVDVDPDFWLARVMLDRVRH